MSDFRQPKIIISEFQLLQDNTLVFLEEFLLSLGFEHSNNLGGKEQKQKLTKQLFPLLPFGLLKSVQCATDQSNKTSIAHSAANESQITHSEIYGESIFDDTSKWISHQDRLSNLTHSSAKTRAVAWTQRHTH